MLPAPVLRLTGAADPPVDDFRLINEIAMALRRFQAGGCANRAVHVLSPAAVAADEMVMVVPHPRFVTGRLPRQLDPPDQPNFRERVQVVVHGLRGKRPQPRAGDGGDGFRISMRSLRNRRQYGQPGSRHAQSAVTQPPAPGMLIWFHEERMPIIWDKSN